MRILAQDVLEYVASDHGMGLSILLSERRTRDVSRPRQIAMYVIRQICPHLSYPAIGHRMGGRDHTTVLHGVRKVESLIPIDPDVAGAVARTIQHFAKRAETEQDDLPDHVLEHAISFQALCASYGRAMRQAA